MLLPCPECGKQISDRAAACPGCGFPIADHLKTEREAQARDADRATRKTAGEVDCPLCEARGFITGSHVNDDGEKVRNFRWCMACEHSGRVILVRSDRGYWAVGLNNATAFVAGEFDDHEEVRFLGAEAPAGHRYPTAGERVQEATDDSQE